MIRKLISTDYNNYAAFVTRVTLGVVMFAHGAQKLLGWFGGYGFNGSMNYFTESVGLPWVLGFLIILIESIGALLLITGFASRFMSVCIMVVTLGIIFTSHHEYFFMNWFGNQANEGYEFFLLMIGLGASVVVSGGGAFSIDAFLQERWHRFKKYAATENYL